jgi:hypothetical protein
MSTLAEIALDCAKMLGRANADGSAILDLESEIKGEIARTVEDYNRKPWHLTEVLDLGLTTVADQTWYAQIDETGSLGAELDAQTDNATQFVRTATNQLVLAEAVAFPVDASRILKIDYMRDNTNAIYHDITHIDFSQFQRMQRGTTLGGPPIYYTRYAERIGLYPTPNGVFNITMSATVKPAVPVADTDKSVWFDKGRELVTASACGRVCLKYLRDPDRAAEFGAIAGPIENNMQAEFARKRATGRLVPHD